MLRFSFATLLAVTAPAAAEDWVSVTPVFSQIVAFKAPDGFVPAFEGPGTDNYIQEAVLDGETADAWSQMLTLTGLKDAVGTGEHLGTIGYANALAESYAKSCPNSFQAQEMPTGDVPGAREVFAALMGCGEVEDGSKIAEGAVIVVLAGAKDIYTVQWAERFDVTQGPHIFDPKDWQDRLTFLTSGTRICDPVAGEAPPYPSCTGQ